MIGQTILQFKIVKKLGAGGMGVVYKGVDTKLERTVAIKFLPREIAAQDDVKKRFKVEAKAAAALNHPNIATIYQIEEVEGELFIVMEFIGGQELREIVETHNDASLPVDEIITYSIQIGEGLQAAHEKGVVHRDIKSSNIMITDKGQIKIMDFGLAQLTGQTQLTKTGTTMGTVAYMSPEQTQGVKVDHRTDIWAFGVVLYEMLTGQLPFKGDYEQAVMYSILHEEPEPLNSFRPDIPILLSNVVHKALQKDPEERYKSMQNIIRDFKGALNVDSESISTYYDSVDTLPKPAGEVQRGHVPPQGERRQVSIVISALSGYDSLVENLEREEVNDVMKALGRKVTEIVSEQEGLINQFSEDEIVLLFGVPIAHEDDPSRAVGSALELHESIRQLNEELSDRIEKKIHIHSGIDVGLVVVQPRDNSSRRFKLTGEPTRIASRLAAEANEDEILISPQSRRLIKPFFDTESCGESFTIRGRSHPVKPFVIKGKSGFRTRFEASASATLTAFVGREKELDILRSDLAKTIDGDGQFVTVVGEAGLGKSRLLYEFRNQLDDNVDILQGSCQSFARNIPYFPFVALLRELLDIGPEDNGQNQVEMVVSRILDLDSNLEVYISLFLQLFSIDSAKYPLPDHIESDNIQQAIVEGLSAIFTLAANKKPIVILLEDWHWVDNASQNVLQQLAEMASSFPLYLVVTYRPEVAFEWGNPVNHKQIQLTPLEESCSLGVVKSVLEAESLPDDLAALIHKRTGGNPFFIEELTQTLHEGGIIKIEERKVILADSKSKIDLPHTIQAVIRSRLDRLGPDSIEVLRVAAVIGREFTQNILKDALADEIELHESVKTLRDLGLIRQIHVLPEATFRFKHILTQEVVYDSLLKHQKKSLHGLIGGILEKSYDDRLGDKTTLLMEHFSHSEHWEKAIHYGCKATDNLMMQSFSVVLNILDRVEHWISKLPENQEREAILIDVLLKKERTCENLGYLKRQNQIIDRLLTLIESDDIKRAEVYIRLGDLFILSNRLEEAENALKEAHRLSKEIENEDTELRVLRSMGFLKVRTGRDDEAASIIQNVIEMGFQKGMATALVGDLNSLFTILIRLGNYDGAKKCLDDALELYDQVLPRHRTYINFMAGNYYRHMGDYDKAISNLKTMVQIWEEAGTYGKPTTALVPMAQIYLIQGNVEEALRCYEKAVDMSRTAKIASELANALYAMATALVSLGRTSESLPHLEEAVLVFSQLEDSENEIKVLCTIANILEKDGRYNDAFSTWEKVREMGKESGDLRIEFKGVKGMAGATRNLADDSSHPLKYYKEAEKLAQKLANLDEQGEILNTMGIIEWQLNHFDAALSHYEKALKIFLEKKDQIHTGFVLNSIAATLTKLNRPEEALSRLQEAIQIHKQGDQHLLEGHALALRGDIYFDLKKLNQAKKNYENSLQLRQKVSDLKGEGWMSLQLAKVFDAQGLTEKNQIYAERALTIAKKCDDSNFLNEVQAQLK